MQGRVIGYLSEPHAYIDYTVIGAEMRGDWHAGTSGVIIGQYLYNTRVNATLTSLIDDAEGEF
ncbi:MAG: hypothetical protein QXJ19_07860 [Candidatus Bathyarchaeia archaeon]|nr:hypothetical protein [Candidatus Bathyarchaeota archaeon]